MLKIAYVLSNIHADTAENELNFAEILPIGRCKQHRPSHDPFPWRWPPIRLYGDPQEPERSRRAGPRRTKKILRKHKHRNARNTCEYNFNVMHKRGVEKFQALTHLETSMRHNHTETT